MTRPTRWTLATAAAFALALIPSARADGLKTYIALGDSLAFGETDFTQNPSYGDRGYVSLYANWLATQNGGVRPNVINLGVDAETSSTFFQGGPTGDGTIPGLPGRQLNLNDPSPAPSQNGLLLSTINTQEAQGNQISTVSVQLGANDLFQVVGQPNFFTLSPAQQQAAIAQAIGTIATNDTALLSELKGLVPNAHILMMGYYNPYNADPTSPIGQIADPAIRALNALIAKEADAFGAQFVNLYPAFVGHELGDTYIATGNVHPNAQGYALIATQMETVPEPSSVLVIGACMAGGLVAARRRRNGQPAR